MQIKCNTIAEMVEVCAGLVREGVTFQASTSDYVITLTGGY